ncbi:MAG TPA: Na(+)-translocating NADH-quinone reductase subunit C [Pseudomonadales bacterium]|nr:Na(+)-translocating NADH-quinone reductase subunit C [Pseudomonadales bacterium]
MASDRDGIGNVIMVAVSVCLVCSILVAGAAVALKPAQRTNKLLDQKQNVLIAAGLLEEGETTDAQGRGIEDIFADFEIRVVDLDTGEYSDAVDPTIYDQIKAARDADRSRALSGDEDIATIKRLEEYGLVYLKRGANGDVETAVIPIRGYGLWGTLYGFLALEGDFETVAGIGFYEHKETPGLGGEVENPTWKVKWQGKELFDASGEPAIELTKTLAPQDSDLRDHQIDALSGATMTSRGVENLVNFWAGDLGYGPYLKNMRQGNV